MTIVSDIVSFFQSEAVRSGALAGALAVITLFVVVKGWPWHRRKKIKDGYNVPEAELRPKRDELIRKIGKKHGSRVIAIIHREHTPNNQHIDEDTAEDMLNVLRQVGRNERLDIILHTPGGYTLDTLRIAFAVKAHKGHKTVFVPYQAMSGGTLIALAADEIVMADHAVLGPIDPTIGGIPAASLIALRNSRDAKGQSMEDIIALLADMGEKAMRQVRVHACELLHGKDASPDRCAVTNRLVSGEWTHDYPITKSMAHEMGLPISKVEVPEEVFALISLYRDLKKQEPSVKYELPSANQRIQLTLSTPMDHH